MMPFDGLSSPRGGYTRSIHERDERREKRYFDYDHRTPYDNAESVMFGYLKS
ncbi:hypothetical protein [Natrinema sp. 1APR25-10V2]|uniref:hypothetical protein n=1 Tax=Natrinema sp. 1APR25-10V2 TaxID=2951081 RepID=UPI002875F030|nr:hypothetical protein [Natrinema sp. 1APR25-10V2]MDS0474565.1 hypothetical protein [Natrinema sp. 1APR25-10V2]